MRDLIVEAMNNVINRELAEKSLVRDEIKDRGTYWAASEIWKPRRQVKALRKQRSEHDARSRT